MTMKVTPDDPRLSAYLLGELSPDEAAVIKRAVAADPAIRMSLRELEKTVGLLGRTLGANGEHTLQSAQREAIRQAARDADSLGKVVELSSAKRNWRPWLSGLGAAAVVAFAAVLMSRIEPDETSMTKGGSIVVSDEVALLPLPGPAIGEGSTSVASDSAPVADQTRSLGNRPGEFLRDVAKHLDRSPLPDATKLPPTGTQSGFSAGPKTRLPVVLGRSSLRWVSGWVLEKQQLPPKNAVRVEELVNNAALVGAVEVGGLKVAIESMPCPWSSVTQLVGVQFQAGDEAVTDLQASFQSLAERRVLGSFLARDNQQLPTVLPAKHRTMILLELDVAQGPLGRIEITQGDKFSSLEVPAKSPVPSANLNHAANLAGFGLWLRGEGVDASQLREMLQAASSDSDSVRSEIRRMMNSALKLADSER